jgi:hypothetical protein
VFPVPEGNPNVRTIQFLMKTFQLLMKIIQHPMPGLKGKSNESRSNFHILILSF